MTNHKCPACLADIAEGAIRCDHCGIDLPDMGGATQPEKKEVGDGSAIFQAGDIINDRYVVLEQIGSGGMGTIYKVQDKVLDEVLALKVLLPYLLTDQAVVDRFMNEVRITRKIAHPNIVRVHDFGIMDAGMFISMEYVEGETLRERLARLVPGEHLTLRFILHIVNQICIALKYAHHFTVHRDIKPDNIMITPKKHIKLMDFGISKIRDPRFSDKDNAVVGTLHYMAPEQMANAQDLDGRADIFSVGVVFYELLTGRLPANGMNPLSEMQHVLPPPLLAVLQKCMAPDRARRYQNADELREALRPIIEGLELDSAPGIPAQQISSFDTPHSSGSSEIFAEAMQAFMSENKQASASTNGRAERPGSLFPSGPITQSMLSKAIILGVIVLGATVLYLRADTFRAGLDSCKAGSESSEAHAFPNHALTIIAEGGTALDALEEAMTVLTISDTPANREIAEKVRQQVILDIESRVYAAPFELEKLNDASSDIALAAQIDADPRMRQLADVVTREASQFKFVATQIDYAEKTATFRLNNPYISFDTQTVSEGDMLQDRFLVTRIGPRYVSLEDTSAKGSGRKLIARIMERIEAE